MLQLEVRFERFGHDNLGHNADLYFSPKFEPKMPEVKMIEFP